MIRPEAHGAVRHVFALVHLKRFAQAKHLPELRFRSWLFASFTLSHRLGYHCQPARGVAQPGSAPEWGSGGRRFKSSRPDQSPNESFDILPGPKAGDSCDAQGRHCAAPQSLRWVPAAGGIAAPLTSQANRACPGLKTSIAPTASAFFSKPHPTQRHCACVCGCLSTHSYSTDRRGSCAAVRR